MNKQPARDLIQEIREALPAMREHMAQLEARLFFLRKEARELTLVIEQQRGSIVQLEQLLRDEGS